MSMDSLLKSSSRTLRPFDFGFSDSFRCLISLRYDSKANLKFIWVSWKPQKGGGRIGKDQVFIPYIIGLKGT